MTRKNKIILSSTVLISGIGYFAVSHIMKNSLYKKVLNNINNNVSSYGDVRDISYFDGNAYISHVKNNTSKQIIKLKDAYVTQFRKGLHDAISGWGTDEDKIKSIFRQLKDGVQIAQVSQSYYDNYGKTLLQDMLDDMNPDSDDMKEINSIIQSKPKFRTL